MPFASFRSAVSKLAVFGVAGSPLPVLYVDPAAVV
jgi:hypothetical protein